MSSVYNMYTRSIFKSEALNNGQSSMIFKFIPKLMGKLMFFQMQNSPKRCKESFAFIGHYSFHLRP